MNNHFLNKRFAYLLGFAGSVPFLLLMIACWTVQLDWLGYFIRGQLAYGIAVLSFLGGMHWSAAMLSTGLSEEQTRKAFVWSVLPPILAWSATLMGGFGFAILMAGFILAYQVDKRLLAWYRMPDWFLRLRLWLTCAVVATLALSVIAVNVRG